jgi:hypothetical protein
MCKPVQVAVVVLLIGAAGVVAFQILCPKEREPSYQGRRLSAWLLDLVKTYHDAPDAVAAVRAIGTNAVPDLLRKLPYSPNNTRTEFYCKLDSLLHHKLHLTGRTIVEPAALRSAEALKGFEALGPTASNAVPGLSALLDVPQVGERAAVALAYIGPGALPALMEALTNRSPTARFHALGGIGCLGTNAGPGVPLVLSCVTDTNVPLKGYAIRYRAVAVLAAC